MFALLLILIAPIATWFAVKEFGPANLFKRMLTWFGLTWIVELGIMLTIIT
jgi:hypothetical protein